MRPPIAHQRAETFRARSVPEARRLRERRVVHLTTHLDRGVLDLLGPATAALARSGSEQTVVLIDHLDGRSLLPRVADSTHIVLVPLRRNPVTQWRALSAAFARAVVMQRPDAVHLHGPIAASLGEHVLANLDSRIPALYSQSGAGLRGTLKPLAALAQLLGRTRRGTAPARAIGHGTAEGDVLAAMGHESVAVVEGPVDGAYFDVSQHAARHPLIVSGSRVGDLRSAEAFDQLAVLLGGDGLGLKFNWIGPVDAVASARLKAAGVGVFDSAQHTERAAGLAAAWMFVALTQRRGFPLCLAEAMAAGLPCVALDTPAHRSLVRHGDTGYLCRSQAEVIDRIAQLADTASLRERMGRAGRALALERFGQARFDRALLAAYAVASPATVPVPRPVLVRQGGMDLPELP